MGSAMFRAKLGRKKMKLSAKVMIITASRTSTKLSHQTSAAKRRVSLRTMRTMYGRPMWSIRDSVHSPGRKAARVEISHCCSPWTMAWTRELVRSFWLMASSTAVISYSS